MLKVLTSIAVLSLTAPAYAWNNIDDRQVAFSETNRSWVSTNIGSKLPTVIFNVYTGVKCEHPERPENVTKIKLNGTAIKVAHLCMSNGDHAFYTTNTETFIDTMNILYGSKMVTLQHTNYNLNTNYYPERIWPLAD